MARRKNWSAEQIIATLRQIEVQNVQVESRYPPHLASFGGRRAADACLYGVYQLRTRLGSGDPRVFDLSVILRAISRRGSIPCYWHIEEPSTAPNECATVHYMALSSSAANRRF